MPNLTDEEINKLNVTFKDARIMFSKDTQDKNT